MIQSTERLEQVVFYGATRFEAPRLGHTFRNRNGKILTVAQVSSEHLAPDFESFTPRAWRFVAHCRELTPKELRAFGRQDEYDPVVGGRNRN